LVVFLPESASDEPFLPAPPVWLASAEEETHRVRILFVEDNALVAEAIASLLVDAGHEVVTAADGEEAWTRLSAQPDAFDLVISDLNLPGISGRELLEKISKQHIPVPVLMVTGYSEMEEIELLRKLGAKAVLKKPVQTRELLDFVAYYAGEKAASGNPGLGRR